MAAAGGKEAGLRTFAGAVALVTGGASGIGAGLGRELARRGAFVVLADRDGEDARTGPRGSRPRVAGPRARPSTCATRPRWKRSSRRSSLATARLDYLFNNAGIAVGGEARELALEDWRDAVEVNLMGVVHGVQAAWPRMIAQGFGHVVNTASMAAFMATALAAPYGATKSATVGLSRALRVEGAALGARASASSAPASSARRSSRAAGGTGASAPSSPRSSRRPSGSARGRWTRTPSRGSPWTTWPATAR